MATVKKLQKMLEGKSKFRDAIFLYDNETIPEKSFSEGEDDEIVKVKIEDDTDIINIMTELKLYQENNMIRFLNNNSIGNFKVFVKN